MVLRTDGIDATGARIVLDERNAGVRRAEIEAQIDRFKADPSLLRSSPDAYAARNPGRPPLVEVDIVEAAARTCATRSRPARSPRSSWRGGKP